MFILLEKVDEIWEIRFFFILILCFLTEFKVFGLINKGFLEFKYIF